MVSGDTAEDAGKKF